MPTKTTPNPLYWPGKYSTFTLSNSGNPWGVTTHSGPIIWETYDTRVDGGPLADWKGKLERGEQATTMLQGQRYRYRYRSSSATLRMQKQFMTGVDDYATLKFFGSLGVQDSDAIPSNANTDSYNEAYSTAASVFNSRALEAQRALQGAVSLGELAQTLRMVKRPMQTLRRKMDDYLGDVQKRAKGRSSVPSKTQVVADTWLEHSLGWRPLINDLNGLRDAIGRTQDEESRKDVYGSGTRKRVYGPYRVSGNIGPETIFTKRWKVVDIISVRFVGQVRVRGGNPGTKDLLGLSGSNALPTLWELIPYSFIADYFGNFGQIIDAVSLRRGDLIWCEQRTKTGRTTTFLPVQVDGVSSGTWKVLSVESDGGDCTITRDDVTRGVQGGWPIPSFQFRIPGLGNPRQWANLAALLASSRRASYAIAG